MRAVQYTEYGGPEVLSVTDVPEPHAGPGQVRIGVRAASVNPIDWKVRSGAYGGGTPDGPQIPGADASGVVDEVGEGVTGVAIGDEVFGLANAAYAESAVLRAWAPKPADVDWAVAAGAAVAGETSVRALGLLGLDSGDTVFIAGGSGGVGTVAVQLAVARGLEVIASAGPGTQDYLRELGARPVVYGDGLVDAVRAAAGGEHVDGVFDVVGKTPGADLFSLVTDPARVVSIANFSLAEAGGQVTGGRPQGDPQAALAEIAELLAEGRVRIPTDVLALDEAGEAQRRSAEGHARGKIVLVV